MEAATLARVFHRERERDSLTGEKTPLAVDLGFPPAGINLLEFLDNLALTEGELVVFFGVVVEEDAGC